jgi:hypothetical protein
MRFGFRIGYCAKCHGTFGRGVPAVQNSFLASCAGSPSRLNFGPFRSPLLLAGGDAARWRKRAPREHRHHGRRFRFLWERLGSRSKSHDTIRRLNCFSWRPGVLTKRAARRSTPAHLRAFLSGNGSVALPAGNYFRQSNGCVVNGGIESTILDLRPKIGLRPTTCRSRGASSPYSPEYKEPP